MISNQFENGVKFPLLIVNFKTYQTAYGKNGIRLAKYIDKISIQKNLNSMIAAQPSDIFRISKITKSAIVISQHIDPVDFGTFTGSILPESVMENGAKGTLLNHSERRLDFETLTKAVKRAKAVGLLTIVCAQDDNAAEKISALEPDIISVEPPELISTGIAVSQARPEVITKTLEKTGDIPVLCGAGIRTAEDVRRALELGAKGILIASGVTLAKNPKKYLLELCKGFDGHLI